MKTTFVNLKSEVTAAKDAAEAKGLDVYRCRLHCNCKAPQNRRNGILIVDAIGSIVERVIRCKACTKTPKSPEGDLKGGQL